MLDTPPAGAVLGWPLLRVVAMVAVALLGAPAEAHAQRRARTPVALVVASDAPQDWGWEVRAALRRTKRLDPRAIEAAPVARGGQAASAEEQMLAATSEAERAFRQADFDACVHSATTAERRLAPVLAEVSALRRLAPLVALAAACELKRGATAVALERASLALALDPVLVLDPARHPPDVAALFEQARTARAAAPSVTVTLTANVPDARFEVDGRATEAEVQVAAGTHWIAAQAPGARMAVRAVAIAEAGELALDLQPADAAHARSALAALPRSADVGPGTARAAALATGARYACTVTQPRPGRIAIELSQVEGLRVSRLGRAEAAVPSNVDGWSALLGRVHTLLRPRPRATSNGGVPGWVWITGAAAVVAAGTIITIAAWPEEPEDRIELVPGGACFGSGCCEWPDCL